MGFGLGQGVGCLASGDLLRLGWVGLGLGLLIVELSIRVHGVWAGCLASGDLLRLGWVGLGLGLLSIT